MINTIEFTKPGEYIYTPSEGTKQIKVDLLGGGGCGTLTGNTPDGKRSYFDRYYSNGGQGANKSIGGQGAEKYITIFGDVKSYPGQQGENGTINRAKGGSTKFAQGAQFPNKAEKGCGGGGGNFDVYLGGAGGSAALISIIINAPLSSYKIIIGKGGEDMPGSNLSGGNGYCRIEEIKEI